MSEYKCSEETKRKISNSLKGHIYPKERNLKISLKMKGRPSHMLGKHHSEKTKKILKNKLSIKMNQKEIKEKISNSLKKYYYSRTSSKKGKKYEEYYGKEKSEQIKEKMRNNGKDKNRGRRLTEEQKRKIGIKNSINMKNMYLSHPERIEYQRINRNKQILPIKDTSIEIKIQNFLKQLNIDFFTHQYIKEIEHGYQCDILIPSMNLVIECDGDYWHKYPVGREIDHIRTKELLDKGFKVLRLWEHEINEMNIEKFKQSLKWS